MEKVIDKTLYVVATPIGNLNEISLRAIDILSQCDFFICEDTRVSKKLLTLLKIKLDKKNFVFANGFNEKKQLENLNLSNKKNVVLLSDAGYPSISDPGYLTINYFLENNWSIKVINGPCSLIHAFVASAFGSSNFYFHGFLSNNLNEKIDALKNLYNYKTILIFFESVHRIKETLSAISKLFGSDTIVCVCRELSKINEQIYKGKVNDLINNIFEKGEFVILIDNRISKNKEINFYEVENDLKKLILKGEKEKNACKMVAFKYNLKANLLFKFWQEQKNRI